ncbi:MAG: hypothetical protein V3U67_03520 [Gemmatimonadota bacterium]
MRAALSLHSPHPDSAHVASILDRWGRDAGTAGPAAPDDSLAVAGLWRRAGQTDLALSWLPDETPVRSVAVRALLERARILFQAPPRGPREDTYQSLAALAADASDAFWLACEHLDKPAMNALWHDIRGLATPDEQEAWAALSLPEACPWVRSFVDERAWRTASTPEERLSTHYRRLYFVRDRYYLSRPRLTRDMSNRLGRPDSLEIDDRGLIYLRMGQPDANVGGFEVRLQLNESWAYHRHEGPRVYHFAPVSRTGLRAMGDFRLLENLAHATGRTMPSELLSAGGAAYASLYRSRWSLDRAFEDTRFRYRKLASRMVAAGDANNPGFLGLLASERQRTRADARYAITGIPDVPTITPLVRFAYEVLQFRNPDGTTEAWILGSARSGDLTARGVEGGGVRYGVEATLAMMTPEGYQRKTVRNEPLVSNPLAADDAIPVRLSWILGPGRYPYSLAVRDQQFGRGGVGNWAQDTLVIADPVPGLPEVSDIAVAADSGGTWTRDGETWLRVLPNHVVGLDGSLFTYFEVYGFPAGQEYDVEIRVVADQSETPLFLALAPELTFALNFRAQMPVRRDTPGRHSLRLDLDRTPPGSYLLAVRVANRVTGRTSLPRVTPIAR